MTEILRPDAAGIAHAAELLRAGELVAFGTETVYGLGADATQARAVACIFEAKGRPHFNPLICHYPDAESAFAHVEANPAARRLAEAFWPGPLTLVLPRRVTCPVALLAGAGLETLAVRVPAQADTLALLRVVGRPVAAPSANRSGQVSPTTAAHVLEGLGGRIAAVLDSGPCPVGVESSVLDLTGPRPFLLRPGGATCEAIEAVVGPVGRGITPAAAQAARTLRSPGLMVSHYAPTLPVRLAAQDVAADEALLAFGPPLPGAGAVFQLSAAGNLTEAAANLFTGLRALDAEGQIQGLRGIAVMAVPESGLGLAINDRLQRASAPRS
ncbi:Threonylcarbamoyl-AMP synthase [Rhodovastum atsumiense]|uniref:Threonylcarbamoyl-AMP synthase n=1 Tax=Rhodovastum atsumiense TaxID=504468 RepID=A0A5M6IUQ5_9PROT|nr:L-threonylcarbamoyladenylate synthase [Rhodovastum atsumiense]KAA5612016.1 threonylcarbamoyl-AMP synthase [Rhodovastum atsumiense]CAH2604124.1 Threonylcarbamoyl-AMP synthase [Rhodovastum atsumiense]